MSVHQQLSCWDIEGVRVGRFGGRVNTTSILWRLGSTIIDTGPANQWSEVRHFIEAAPVAQVIVTHHHEDHAGNLGRCSRLGIDRLLAPPESIDLLACGFRIQPYRRIVWGTPRRVTAAAFRPEVDLPDGGALDAILLPGHSPDMTCLFEPERKVVFGADIYVGRRLRYLRRDENLNGIIAAIERLLTIDFDTLLCSHRGIVQNPHDRLNEKLDHLLELREEARALDRQGIPTAEITRRLLGPEDFITTLSLGHFSKRNLVLACLHPEGSVSSPPSV